MTAYARVITIGKNSAMPKTVYMPFGVGVDGGVIKYPVTIQGDEIICPACSGWREIETWDGNPGHRSETDRCERCDGQGIIEIENPDVVCLPASGLGRPELNDCTVSGRPSSPGVQPVARAAGDLPRFTGRKTHTVLRCVPKAPQASSRPALECPPDAAPGTFTARTLDVITTLGGLAVFGMIALFLLVLS